METKCNYCGNEFIKSSFNQKYCNKECSKLFYKEYYEKEYDKVRKTTKNWQTEIRVCLECQTEFVPKSHNQKYCKIECSMKKYEFDAVHSNIDILSDGPAHRWLKARILVFDRDDFTCKYCGRSPMVDKDVRLHCDHKFPKSLGGDDSLENLITSCEQCNLGKGDILLKYWQLKHEENTIKARN